MVYLVPHSGLANRIRVIISALAFSEKFGQGLTLVWRKDAALNCEFEDLFEPSKKFSVKKYGLYYKALNNLQSRALFRDYIYRFWGKGFTLLDKNFQEYVWSTGGNVIDYTKIPTGTKQFFIATCNEFYFDIAYNKYLRPQAMVQEKIHNTISQFNDKTIGLHIRRSDHIEAIQRSPLQLFINAVKKEIDDDSEANFYLATDDPVVERTIIQLYPERIYCQPKEFSRITKEGMQAALVDLYCLANTRKIYGSYFSSFSHFASRINGVPLEILQTHE